MGYTWPHHSEEIIKFVTVVISLTVFIFQFWQSSIKRKTEYNAALVIWGNEVIRLLHQIADYKNTDKSDLGDQLLELEIAISRGRLFFPNKRVPKSKNGWRPRILDWLVYSLMLVKFPEPFSAEARFTYLQNLKKGYIRDLQLLIRPTAFSSTMMSLKVQIVSGRLFDKGPMDTSQERPPIDILADEYGKSKYKTPLIQG